MSYYYSSRKISLYNIAMDFVEGGTTYEELEAKYDTATFDKIIEIADEILAKMY